MRGGLETNAPELRIRCGELAPQADANENFVRAVDFIRELEVGASHAGSLVLPYIGPRKPIRRAYRDGVEIAGMLARKVRGDGQTRDDIGAFNFKSNFSELAGLDRFDAGRRNGADA